MPRRSTTRLLDQARALHEWGWERRRPAGGGTEPMCRHSAMLVVWWAEERGVLVRLPWPHMRGRPIQFRHVMVEILLDGRGERPVRPGERGRWYCIDSKRVSRPGEPENWTPWSGWYEGDASTPMRSALWYSRMLDDGREFSRILGDYLRAMRGEVEVPAAILPASEVERARGSWSRIPAELAAVGYGGPWGREGDPRVVTA